MKKRVFIGIPISDQLKDKVSRWTRKNIKEKEIRIIKSNNLHITLVPPWYEPDVTSIKKKLETLRYTKFNIHFRTLKYGPTRNRPRLIWAEGKIPKQLIHLIKLLERLFYDKTKKRKHHLHLTIARFKEKDFRNFKNKNLMEYISWKQKVNSISLYESKLSPKGADYTILKNIIL